MALSKLRIGTSLVVFATCTSSLAFAQKKIDSGSGTSPSPSSSSPAPTSTGSGSTPPAPSSPPPPASGESTYDVETLAPPPPASDTPPEVVDPTAKGGYVVGEGPAPGLPASDLPYYVPNDGERFRKPAQVTPPAPERPDPPSLKLTLGAYYEVHNYFGDRAYGTGHEIGLALGGNVWGVEIGYLPNSELGVVGFEIPHLMGIPLVDEPDSRFSFLLPHFNWKMATNLDDTVMFGFGGSALGLSYAHCSGFFIDARAPTLYAWLPLVVAGSPLVNADPIFSWGAGLETGFLFF